MFWQKAAEHGDNPCPCHYHEGKEWARPQHTTVNKVPSALPVHDNPTLDMQHLTHTINHSLTTVTFWITLQSDRIIILHK